MATTPEWKIPWHEVTDPDVAFIAAASSWGIPQELFERVWQRATGKEIIIANLDSGVRSSHKLFQQPGKIISKRSYVGGDVEDDNGHGTMTASNSSGHHDDGDFIGVAPDSKLIVKKVFTAGGSGPSITQSVRDAVNEGADIINYSGGGNSPYGPTLEASEYARENNVLMFAASGNAGPNSKNYPGYYSMWNAVGSIKQSGGLSAFSTTNDQVDVAAPGEQVTVANRSGGYSKANGTSFACPHMAGAAALVLELNYKAGRPRMSIDQFREFLIANSGPDIDPHPTWRYGVFNLASVLEKVASEKLTWI